MASSYFPWRASARPVLASPKALGSVDAHRHAAHATAASADLTKSLRMVLSFHAFRRHFHSWRCAPTQHTIISKAWCSGRHFLDLHLVVFEERARRVLDASDGQPVSDIRLHQTQLRLRQLVLGIQHEEDLRGP